MEKKEILGKLKEFYEYTGEIPTVADCDGLLLPKYYLVRRVGGLRPLLSELEIQKPEIRESLIETILYYHIMYDKWPRARDCQTEEYMRSHMMYVEEFGSWKEAINVARSKTPK